ncbi:MAG: hypothetical protein JO227_03420 [Acetobacteraceae bacterium]|nr:hypothetical protein [Acetobacteraceae bacterium]
MVIADRSSELTGKPRSALVVQSDFFSEANTVVICPAASPRLNWFV